MTTSDEILVSKEELRKLREDIMALNKVGPFIVFDVWVRVVKTVNSWLTRPSAYVKPSQLEFSELASRVNKLEKAINETIPEEFNSQFRYINSLHDSAIKLIREINNGYE